MGKHRDWCKPPDASYEPGCPRDHKFILTHYCLAMQMSGKAVKLRLGMNAEQEVRVVKKRLDERLTELKDGTLPIWVAKKLLLDIKDIIHRVHYCTEIHECPDKTHFSESQRNLFKKIWTLKVNLEDKIKRHKRK